MDRKNWVETVIGCVCVETQTRMSHCQELYMAVSFW